MNSDRIPGAAMSLPASASIGQRSRELKSRHLLGRIWRVLAGVCGICAAAAAASAINRGMTFTGLLLTALGAIVAAALLLRYPRLKVPERAQLGRGPLSMLVGQTELWLEAREPALPPSAAPALRHLGILLDALALELDRLKEGDGRLGAAARQLLARDLPDTVCAFIARRCGEETLNEQLRAISHRIGSLTRRLAER